MIPGAGSSKVADSPLGHERSSDWLSAFSGGDLNSKSSADMAHMHIPFQCRRHPKHEYERQDRADCPSNSRQSQHLPHRECESLQQILSKLFRLLTNRVSESFHFGAAKATDGHWTNLSFSVLSRPLSDADTMAGWVLDSSIVMLAGL